MLLVSSSFVKEETGKARRQPAKKPCPRHHRDEREGGSWQIQYFCEPGDRTCKDGQAGAYHGRVFSAENSDLRYRVLRSAYASVIEVGSGVATKSTRAGLRGWKGA